MKLFVTGISGLLGLNIALQARERYQVSGCYYTHPIVLTGVQALKLDLTSDGDLEQVLDEIRPDIIVHTAGLTNVEACERKPELAYRLNVEASQQVAKMAHQLGAQLVHISTDHLFDGTRALSTESDLPTPLNNYARTKWQAEQAVLEACPNALVIRTNFFGWGTPVKWSFSDWILQGLAAGREMTMFSDVYFTPILINDLISVMIQLIERGASGIFNVVGSERLSKHAFALQIASVFGYPNERICAISVDDFSFAASRPKDMSLSSRKVERHLQSTMPTVVEGLERLQNLDGKGWQQVLEKAIRAETVLS